MADEVVVDKGGADGAAAAAGAGQGTVAVAAGAAAKPAAGAGAQAAASAGASAAGAAGDSSKDVKGVWPDNWLERVSKGDEKRAKDLGRFASPEVLADAYVNLRKRVDSGEFKPALPKNAKPEELAAWRKDNGVPAKAEDYDLKDLKIPKEDKELVGAMVSRLHAKNASNEVVQEAIAGHYAEQDRQFKARAEKDESQRLEIIDALGQEWGGKFSSYRGRVENVLTMFPETVRDSLKSARLPDGTALFNHPDIMRGFLALSLRDVPEGVVVGSGDGDLGKSMVDRYKEIEGVMAKNRTAYNKDEAMQKEHRGLIDALVKHGQMDKNGRLIERKAA